MFVGGDGQRITRGTLQYRVLRAFRQAGIDGTRTKGALLHGLRHTFATELANADVSVYVLMNLLGHEAMTTSQRCITAAGTEPETLPRKAGCTRSSAVPHDTHHRGIGSARLVITTVSYW